MGGADFVGDIVFVVVIWVFDSYLICFLTCCFFYFCFLFFLVNHRFTLPVHRCRDGQFNRDSALSKYNPRFLDARHPFRLFRWPDPRPLSSRDLYIYGDVKLPG